MTPPIAWIDDAIAMRMGTSELPWNKDNDEADVWFSNSSMHFAPLFSNWRQKLNVCQIPLVGVSVLISWSNSINNAWMSQDHAIIFHWSSCVTHWLQHSSRVICDYGQNSSEECCWPSCQAHHYLKQFDLVTFSGWTANLRCKHKVVDGNGLIKERSHAVESHVYAHACQGKQQRFLSSCNWLISTINTAALHVPELWPAWLTVMVRPVAYYGSDD